MTARKTLLFATYTVVVIVVLFVVLGKMQRPEFTLFWRAALNFGHVPLFGLVSLMLLGIVSILFDGGLPRERHYVIAFSWAVFLGGVSEVLQVYIDRNSDMWDFVRNLAGAVTALALAATVDRKFGETGPWRRKNLKWSLRAAAALILLAAFLPLAIGFEAYRQREERFPHLFRFASAFELPLIKARNSLIELSAPPRGWEITQGRKVGKVSFEAAPYPAILLQEVRPDWRSYRYLELDVYLEGEQSLRFVVRIKDVHGLVKSRQHFRKAFDLMPGPSHLRISLSDVRAAPELRELDMSKIHDITIYLRKPGRPVTLYLADLKLSGESGPLQP
jgi:hypothetical protein